MDVPERVFVRSFRPSSPSRTWDRGCWLTTFAAGVGILVHISRSTCCKMCRMIPASTIRTHGCCPGVLLGGGCGDYFTLRPHARDSYCPHETQIGGQGSPSGVLAGPHPGGNEVWPHDTRIQQYLVGLNQQSPEFQYNPTKFS